MINYIEIDENLLINYVPLISTGISFIVTLIIIICKLRNRWPVKVNCWFCAYDLKIPRKEIDWWQCSYCEQYNGFSKDGDYKFKIPEQYKIDTSKANSKSFCEQKKLLKKANSLCFKCIKNEEFKFLKLRELEDSDFYNEKEIEQASKSFDSKYPLCFECQIMVDNVLKNQSIWLAQYKMLFFRNKPITYMIKNKGRIETLFRIALLILASVFVYNSEISFLPVFGVLLQLAVYFMSRAKQMSNNILPLIGWIFLIGLKETPSKNLFNSFELYSNNFYEVYKYFVTLLGLAIALANWNFYKPHSYLKNSSVSFKKLGSSCNNSDLSNNTEILNTSEKLDNDIFFSKITDNLSGQLNKTTSNLNFSKNLNSSLNEKSKSFNNYEYVANSISNSKFGDNSSLNESLSSLHSLSLGSLKEFKSDKSPKMFETKVFNQKIPDLFNKNKSIAKRSILSPPKLKSFTNSSLITGGFWQIGLDLPSLSRSSSQSSGLGSICSSYCQSKEPSAYDFDQCLVSDGINYQFTRPDTPPKKKLNSCYTHEIGNTELEAKKKSSISVIGEKLLFNKLVWLSILLCVSIVTNIAVLYINLR